jgi:hypothetical protein
MLKEHLSYRSVPASERMRAASMVLAARGDHEEPVAGFDD